MSKEKILEEIYERTNGKFNENEYMKKLDILCSILKTSKPFYSEIEEIEFCQKRFTIKCKVDKYEKIGVDRSKNRAKNTAASLMFKELLSIFEKEGHYIEKDNFIVPLFSLCRELKYPAPHFTIMFEKMHENVQQYSCMCIVGDFVTIAKRSSKIKAKHSAAKKMMYVIRHANTVNKTAQVLSPSVIDQMPKTEGAFLCDIDPPNLVDNTLNMFTYLILFCRKEHFPGPILQFDCDNAEENSEKYKISCIVKDIKETAEGESVIFAINLAIKKVLTKLNKYVLQIKLDQEAQLDEKAKRLKKKAKCGKKVNTSSLTIMEDVKIFFINNPFSLNVLKKYNHFKDDPIEIVYKLVENTDLKIDFMEKMNGNDDDSCFISIVGKPALTCFNVGVDCKSKAAHDLLSTMKILIS